MKQKINLYTDVTNFDFLKKILSNFSLIQKNIADLSKSTTDSDNGGIILLNDINVNSINFKILSNNYLIISKNKNMRILKKNFTILEAPLSPQSIKSSVDNFLSNHVFKYHDINIFHHNLLNTKSNKSSVLTEIERKILIFLFQNKKCKKQEIKKNILNLKNNIQTNSVDSHLTRIRKKFDKIKTKYVIKSKNDEIKIDTN